MSNALRRASLAPRSQAAAALGSLVALVLASLALALALALAGRLSARTLAQDEAQTLRIYVPYSPQARERAEALAAALRARPETFAGVRTTAPQAFKARLRPWLDAAALTTAPLPWAIEARSPRGDEARALAKDLARALDPNALLAPPSPRAADDLRTPALLAAGGLLSTAGFWALCALLASARVHERWGAIVLARELGGRDQDIRAALTRPLRLALGAPLLMGTAAAGAMWWYPTLILAPPFAPILGGAALSLGGAALSLVAWLLVRARVIALTHRIP